MSGWCAWQNITSREVKSIISVYSNKEKLKMEKASKIRKINSYQGKVTSYFPGKKFVM